MFDNEPRYAYKRAMNSAYTNLQFPGSIYNLIDFEVYIFLILFSITSYLFYKFLLKNASLERHTIIKNHIKNLVIHAVLLTVFYLVFNILYTGSDDYLFFKKTLPYISVLTYLWGCLLFVKTSRLLVLQYLFLGSMRAGVPLLLVNIFSLLLSVLMLFWSASKIFGLQLTPLLATSAAFSIVLGLALQDTLGNLFAGISLQIDKTFEIDDWLEVQNGATKVIGQVKELTWRSTMLVGFTEEKITLPNKLIASSQIANFSSDHQPIIRSHIIRVHHLSDIGKVKTILYNAALKVNSVKAKPEPFPFIQEITDSWITVKLIYYIDQYGQQYSIGDLVLDSCLLALKENQIKLAHQIYEIKTET
jgi:small-conductance mechanosensitive channel